MKIKKHIEKGAFLYKIPVFAGICYALGKSLSSFKGKLDSPIK